MRTVYRGCVSLLLNARSFLCFFVFFPQIVRANGAAGDSAVPLAGTDRAISRAKTALGVTIGNAKLDQHMRDAAMQLNLAAAAAASGGGAADGDDRPTSARSSTSSGGGGGSGGLESPFRSAASRP